MEFCGCKILALVFYLATLCAVQGQLPEDSCTADGDLVCLSCSSLGTCVQGSEGGFEVELMEECLPEDFCDNSLVPQCFAGNPAITECTCPDSTCISDPNNENAFVHCDTDESSEICDTGNFDLSVCSCTDPMTTMTTEDTPTPEASPTEAPTTTDDATTPEASPTAVPTTTDDATTPEASPTAAPTTTDDATTPEASPTADPTTTDDTTTTEASSTTDQMTTDDTTTPETSSTTDPITTDDTTTPEASSTTESTTTEDTTPSSATTTEGVTPCPNCGYLDFSESDCGRYIYCANGNMIQGACPGITCFDQASCQCVIPT